MVLAVHRLRDNAYGITVREDVVDRVRREVSFGAIYTTLIRLEQDGLLSSKTGSPSPVRGGRAKQLYELTERGIAALNRSMQVIDEMRASSGSAGLTHPTGTAIA